MSTTNHNMKVVIFTDEGEECDDRLGIHYLASRKQDVPIEYTFVFTGTAELSSEECLKNWFDKFQEESKSQWSSMAMVRFTTLEHFKNGGNLVFDWALQIAPMADYDGSNLEIRQKYILAGNADPSKNSINRKKSDAIIEKFQKEGRLMDISSDHMANMRFQPKLLEKFKHMPNFMEGIVFFAFKLAIARMRYDHPVAAKGVAEGLVNSKKGRGTNYKSVKMIHEILVSEGISKETGEGFISSEQAAINYFSKVYKVADRSELPEDSIQCLTEINCMLTDIYKRAVSLYSDEGFLDGLLFVQHPEVFYSDFDIGTIPELLKPMWQLFQEEQEKLIPAFNPVYDLYAAFVLVGEMTNNPGRDKITPDEFVSKICDEF